MVQGSRWSLEWGKRPSEEAAHFNPAFCGELLTRAVSEYERLRGNPLPLPLAFTVLPMTLHPTTRMALPRKANTTFTTWSVEHETILLGVPDRTLRLRPVTREALLFMSQLGALSFERGGVSIGPKPLKLLTKLTISTDDVHDARRMAGLLGRWFAYQPTTAAILQTLGIRV